jgi:hypothetical protein
MTDRIVGRVAASANPSVSIVVLLCLGVWPHVLPVTSSLRYAVAQQESVPEDAPHGRLPSQQCLSAHAPPSRGRPAIQRGQDARPFVRRGSDQSPSEDRSLSGGEESNAWQFPVVLNLVLLSNRAPYNANRLAAQQLRASSKPTASSSDSNEVSFLLCYRTSGE